MSNFTLGPLPCRNPESFSKYSYKKELSKKTSDNFVVVHRNVEGENNGECYKIRGPKTPFLLNHLEKKYSARAKDSQTSRAGGMKREHSDSDPDDELEDPNQPSTSSQSRKKQRHHQD